MNTPVAVAKSVCPIPATVGHRPERRAKAGGGDAEPSRRVTAAELTGNRSLGRRYFIASNVPRPVVWFTMTAADRFSPSGGFLNVALPDRVGTLSIVLRA